MDEETTTFDSGRNEKEENGVTIENLDTSPGIKRDTWSGKLDFMMSCISFAVGLGNIWRFPYLCYRNGGGSFLIPYFISLICGGIPIMILEVGLGQYMSRGGFAAWNICPLFKGIGVGAMIVLFFLNLYYILVLAWAVFYFAMSLRTTLPWSHCDNYWNTERCYVGTDETRLCDPDSNVSIAANTSSFNFSSVSMVTNITNNTGYVLCNAFNVTLNETVDAAVEFWERRVLQITNGIEDSGGVVWELALSLLLVWVVVYFSVWRGVHWTGKVVYVTATFPYVVLTILLIRGVLLDGSLYGITYYLKPDFSKLADSQVTRTYTSGQQFPLDRLIHSDNELVRGVLLDGSLYGITYYLKPDFSKLADSQVWLDGGTQIFFSYAVVLGGMISLGSYNKFDNNFYRDCTIIGLINSGTSLYGGFAVFSVLGFMATKQGIDISKVAESGPGLVFIAYPKAVTQMPLSPLWSILFFIMLFLLGLGSQLVQTEAFITTVSDFFPEQLYRKKGRMIFVAGYCIVSYLLGLTMVTRGGMYIFQLMDYYSASGMVLLFLCFFESIAIGWVFGADRFYDAIEIMVGFRINKWLWLCWKFLTPLCTAGIFMFQVVKFTPLKYNLVYDYPEWAQGIGMLMGIISMLCIPGYIVWRLLQLSGTIQQRFQTLITPVLRGHQIPYKWKEMSRYRWILAGSEELKLNE